MLDIKFIRENPDIVKAAVKNKKHKEVDIDRVLRLAEDRKTFQQEIAELGRKRNEASASRDIEAGKRLKEELKAAEEKEETVAKELLSLLIQIPNIPSPDTPIGADDSQNKVIRQWGVIPQFTFTPKEHFDIAEPQGLIDTKKAGDISGARVNFIKGALVLLQFALLQMALKIMTSEEELKKIAQTAGLSISTKAFTPVIPPVMMRSQVMNRMARLHPIEERYYFEKDDIVLVGSAEHTLGPLHMDEILEEKNLPIRYVGYSTAFRREAGSYGKDTKGILRQHQFDKLEMETFVRPEEGYQEQDFLVAIQEHLLQTLGLPYQVVLVCTGDMGFPDQRQLDIETWMSGQGKYRETHSADYVGGFQARRLNTRFRRLPAQAGADNSIDHVHMNDATALAIGRILIAIIENYQKEDGSIAVPDALIPYVGKERIGGTS